MVKRGNQSRNPGHGKLTQLIATHDLDLALELCPRTLILSQGRLVYDGDMIAAMQDVELLQKHCLEPPLSHGRPYCLLNDRP
jgi:cobalt/nickel transport system ATP-binding protein